MRRSHVLPFALFPRKYKVGKSRSVHSFATTVRFIIDRHKYEEIKSTSINTKTAPHGTIEQFLHKPNLMAKGPSLYAK